MVTVTTMNFQPGTHAVTKIHTRSTLKGIELREKVKHICHESRDFVTKYKTEFYKAQQFITKNVFCFNNVVVTDLAAGALAGGFLASFSHVDLNTFE